MFDIKMYQEGSVCGDIDNSVKVVHSKNFSVEVTWAVVVIIINANNDQEDNERVH